MTWFSKAEQLSNRSIDNTLIIEDFNQIAAWPIDEMPLLFAAADTVRRRFCGNHVDPCTLMNIKSGGCSEDCAFCAQSAHNSADVQTTDLASTEAISARCTESAKLGLPFCVVSSGRRLSKVEVKHIADALAVCKCEKHASLGILDKEDFTLLRNAGVSCYNHNLETARSFFPSIVTTHTYDERVATVRCAKSMGMHVCCGGIFGMGENWEQRIEFCLTLQELDVDTVPINFLNALPGTRIAKPVESPMELLKIVAMFRLAMPTKTIKVCGGREVNLGELQPFMFLAGANGYVTGGYLTTPGAGIDRDDELLAKLGLKRASA